MPDVRNAAETRRFQIGDRVRRINSPSWSTIPTGALGTVVGDCPSQGQNSVYVKFDDPGIYGSGPDHSFGCYEELLERVQTEAPVAAAAPAPHPRLHGPFVVGDRVRRRNGYGTDSVPSGTLGTVARGQAYDEGDICVHFDNGARGSGPDYSWRCGQECVELVFDYSAIVDQTPAFSVGDRVRRIVSALPSGVPVGALGTIVSINTPRIAHVNYEGYGRRISGFGRLERVTEPARQPGEFRVGDRVAYVSRTDYGGPSLGTVGIIRQVAYRRFAVEFPGWRDGHNCHGSVSGDCGWSCEASSLQLVGHVAPTSVQETAPAPSPAPEPAPAPEPMRIGDRVRVTRIAVDGYSAWPPVGSEGIVRQAPNGGNPERESDMIVDFSGVDGSDLRPHNGRRYHCRSSRVALISEIDEGGAPLKAFRLVKLTKEEGEVTIPGEDFDTGREAGERAKVLAAELGCRVQPRPNKLDQDWREREARRFTDGTYEGMPEGWDLEPIPDHFLHLSKKRGWVAFTKDEAFGKADRQLAKRAGAYVREFYPHLSSSEVERYSALVSCEGQLRIGTTREDFKRVYTNGPDSCMSYKFEDMPCHPAEIYAAGDLAIAWLEDDEGNITSRCVVWPEKKWRTRAYGDVEKMRSVLKAAGYTAGNFYGAKLLKITKKDKIVCPYVDECNSALGSPEALRVEIESDHLVICEEDGISTNSTSGWLDRDEEDDEYRDDLVECASCEDRYDEDEMVDVLNYRGARRSWCPSCRDNNAFYCDGLDEYVTESVSSYDAPGGQTWSEFYIDRTNAFVCDQTHAAYPADERVNMAKGEVWCKEIFAEHGFTCAGDGLNYSLDEPHTVIDGKTYHNDNLPEQAEADEGLRAA